MMAAHQPRPLTRAIKTFKHLSLNISEVVCNLKKKKIKLTQRPRIDWVLEYPKQTRLGASQRFGPHKRMNKHPQRWDGWHGGVFFTHWQHERCGSLSEWQGFKTKKRPEQRAPLDEFVNVLCL